MRILLVRLRQIGDVVFTTPAVRALRQRFPEAHISYVVEPAAAPIVAHNPNIDEVIVAPRTARPERASAPKRRSSGGSRRTPYDLAIDFHGGPRASLLTWLSGAPVRVGYDVAGRGWMYTRRITTAARASARGIRWRTSGICWRRSTSRLPEPGVTPWKWPLDREAAAAWNAGSPSRRRARRSADRPARQRGQPVQALAHRIVRGGRGGARGAAIGGTASC